MSGWIKVCGVTTVDDARLVAEAGADAVGINLWPSSPRSVPVDVAVRLVEAVRARVEVVAVTVDMQAAELRHVQAALAPSWLQLHGSEPDAVVAALLPGAYKAIGLATARDVERALAVPGGRLLVDAQDETRHGGTGSAPPWELAAQVCAARPTVLAGGLGSDNVAAAIRACRPYGVDAASRLEIQPGRKDPALVRRFVTLARAAFEEQAHV